jgi:hypothetical protein
VSNDSKPPLVRDALRALREQRRFWVDLGDGLRVQMERPREAEMPRFAHGVQVDDVAACACDWQGFTEATLVGAAGSSQALPFDTDLWGEYVRDNVAAVQACALALADAITAHLQRKADLGNA